MAKRESKGQQVKTFKHWAPLPDGNSEEIVGKVYFQASEGMFLVWLPENVATLSAKLLGIDPGERSGTNYHQYRDGVIRALTLDRVLDLYATALSNYKNTIRNLIGEKVLVVKFEANLRWRDNVDYVFGSGGGTAVTRSDLHFCGSPAIHLSYEVLWKVGENLFVRDWHEPYKDKEGYHTMRSHGSFREGDRYEKRKLIMWTEEREAFIKGVRDNIERLGYAMHDFFKDFENNITHQIATGGKALAIAPPKEPEPVARVRTRVPQQGEKTDETA